MKKVFITVLMLVVFIPLISLAQNGGTATGVAPAGTATGVANPPASSSVAPTAQAHLENPLSGVDNLSGLFYKIVNFVLSFSYIVIACFLIISGFKFVMAQGSETELEKAKKTFYYTLIGAAIIIAAQTITTIVQKIIEGLQ